MGQICFFDLETNNTGNDIREIGAWSNGKFFRGKKLDDFADFAKPYRYLCGHNIIFHDAKALSEKNIGKAILDGKILIDTLFLSVLLFPERPYHHLVKDYALLSNTINDPVADSELCAKVYEDCVEKYGNLSTPLKSIYRSLLDNVSGFKGFFELMPATHGELSLPIEDLRPYILDHYGVSLCYSADLTTLATTYPLQFCLSLALITTPDDSYSVLPPWVHHHFPNTPLVIQQMRFQPCGHTDCTWCTKQMDPRVQLKKLFGFDDFRPFDGDGPVPLQEQVVKAGMARKSLLAIFPTGGGKSLTFQLPALVEGYATKGLTVVLSPLQSLMKDQVDVLAGKFDITRAVAINGLLSPLERQDAMERVRDGRAHLLYISPESLRSNTIMSLLAGRHISRFVIDEAHCFSSWGHDFRVDYLFIGRFLKLLAAKQLRGEGYPVSCFTATAKPEVIDDIVKYFNQYDIDLQRYQTAASRKNLHFNGIPCKGDSEKWDNLLELLNDVKGPAIVYTSRTKSAVKLAERLTKYGIKAAAYHGQMESKDKIEIQNRFMNDEVNVIVATSAFGMGVDKSNVSLVVHWQISDSLENYIQEAGRAGRNEKLDASCTVLYDEEDLDKHFNLLNLTKLSQKEISQVWKGIKDFKRATIVKSSFEIAKKSGWDLEANDLDTRVKMAVSTLEQASFVEREMNMTRLFAQSILNKDVDNANAIIIEKAPTKGFGANDVIHLKRIYQNLISRWQTSVDKLEVALSLEKKFVEDALKFFKENKLIGDSRELSAFIDTSSSVNGSKEIYLEFKNIETAFFDWLFENGHRERVFYLREVATDLHNTRIECGIHHLREILRFWEMGGMITKERVDAVQHKYLVKLKKQKELAVAALSKRLEIAGWVVTLLCTQFSKQIKLTEEKQQNTKKRLIEFSIMELVEAVNTTFAQNCDIDDAEGALLYLHIIKAIELESGLLIFYNPMQIKRLAPESQKSFNKEHYELLEHHYAQKTQQIHIAGEYARLVSNKEGGKAEQLVKDYFGLNADEFKRKWFRGRTDMLSRPVSPQRYERIFKDLSPEQAAIVNDGKSNWVLAAAGPGSGKTRVLVHKVAAMITLENVKPEQFLMLTFSRPAAQEFRQRLGELIGGLIRQVGIFTFHGFAFYLAGRLGAMDQVEDILGLMATAINDGSIPEEQVKCKSVLVIDEFQDVSEKEYKFIKAIIEKAGDIRIFVVGDDDQNIYEFRDADVGYMQKFAANAKVYHLDTNYRAKANLVRFSNLFLETFEGQRLKAGRNLVALSKDEGALEIFSIPEGNQPIFMLCQKLIEANHLGTTAVLTHTNDEANMVFSILKEAGVNVQLIAGKEGYRLSQLMEMQHFLKILDETKPDRAELLTDDEWATAKARLQEAFQGSTTLPWAMAAIRQFEQSKSDKTIFEWFSFAFDIRRQDLYDPQQGRVLVATMHKSKGKEFDQVYLLNHHKIPNDDADRRVLYVAMTRAKSGLYIFTDHPSTFPLPEGVQVRALAADVAAHAQAILRIEMGMDDVYLDSSTTKARQTRIETLKAGMPLGFAHLPTGGIQFNDQGFAIFKTSKAFDKEVEKLKMYGYRLQGATIGAIVRWHHEESKREYWVVLAELVLG